MALQNIKNHVQAVRQNKGILKTDQVQLVATATVPADADLVNGRLYYNTSLAAFRGYAGGAWVTLQTAAGTIVNWDDLYDNDQTLSVDSVTMTFAGATALAAGDVVTISAVAAVTGDCLQFSNSGTGSDVKGTSSTWSVSAAGASEFQSTVTVGSLVAYAAGANGNLTVDAKGTGTITLAGTSTGAITLTTATTATVSLTITGSADADVLTITDGDVLMSNGKIAITNDDTDAILTMTANSVTTGNAILLTANGVTTGNMLSLVTTDAGLTSGFYIRCNDGSDVFTIGDEGATVIVGAGATDMLTVTAGDAVLSDGSITVTDADDAVSLSVTNNTATSASVFVFAGSGTFTGTTTTSFFTVTPSGLTTGTGMYVIGAALNSGILGDFATDATMTSGTILRLQSTGANSANTSGRGLLVDNRATAITSTVNKITDWVAVASNRTTTTGTVADDFDMVSLIKTSELDGAGSMSETGSVLRIENAVTNTSGTVTSTSKGIEVVMDSLGTGDGVEITHAATGAVALDIISAATTVSCVLITGSGVKANNKASLEVVNTGATAAGGSTFRVSNTGTPAAATSYLADFDYTGATHTNNPVGVIVQGGASTAQALEVTSTGAGANNLGVLSVTTTGATVAGGSVLRVTATGTPGAATSYMVDFDYSGATMTNNPTTVFINAGASTNSVVELNTSGASAANKGMISLLNTNTGAEGVVFHAQHTSTGSAANNDDVFVLKMEGLDSGDAVTEYARMTAEIQVVTAGAEDGRLRFDAAADNGTLTLMATINPRAGGALAELVMGTGAGNTYLTTSGAYDLILDTNQGTNSGNITITDAANGAITLTPNGTGLIDLAGKVVFSETTTSSGAGAVSVNGHIHEITTTAADALTLADGTEGQRLAVIMVTDGGDGTLTPTNLAGAQTTITFDAVGESVDLLFTNGSWHIVGSYGVAIA